MHDVECKNRYILANHDIFQSPASSSSQSCSDFNATNCLPLRCRNLDDMRFVENQSVLDWLLEWEKEVSDLENMRQCERSRRFISYKTKFDLFSMVLGFKSFCGIIFQKFQDAHIKTKHTSQDYLELFFSCQRAQDGQNDNPTMLQYGKKIFFRL